jgi:hypothetical protein
MADTGPRARAWAEQAESDARTAEALLERPPPMRADDVGCHVAAMCAQAVEKSIKGYVILNRGTPKLSHRADKYLPLLLGRSPLLRCKDHHSTLSTLFDSLPHAVDLGRRSRDEAAKERLRALLKNERSRRLHWEEILELRESGPELERVYHQERGKADARHFGRCLRGAGVNPGWFALYEGMVIASAPTREEVISRVREVLPTSRSDLPYLYQFRK